MNKKSYNNLIVKFNLKFEILLNYYLCNFSFKYLFYKKNFLKNKAIILINKNLV